MSPLGRKILKMGAPHEVGDWQLLVRVRLMAIAGASAASAASEASSKRLRRRGERLEPRPDIAWTWAAWARFMSGAGTTARSARTWPSLRRTWGC